MTRTTVPPARRALLPTATVTAGIATVLTGLLMRYVVPDYRRWRDLGEGGVPSNPIGYAITTAARIGKREAYSSQPYSRAMSDPDDAAHLPELPERRGRRPQVNPDPIPQRQLDQLSPELVDRTREIFGNAVAARSWLGWQRSGFEHHHEALTARDPDAHIRITRRTRGEIAHIHPGDGSMHMVLSAHDASQVVDKGWGERHGLAGRGPLPLTYLLIYAPRDADELTIVEQILDASLAHMGQVSTKEPR